MSNTTDGGPKLPYAVVFGTIMSIGFPLNAIAIWILLRHHSLKSPSVIFMLNLAIADLLLACSLPLKVYFHATGDWPLDHATCIGVRELFNVNIRTSSVFITFISVDRFLAVVYPLRSRHVRTARNAVKAVILTWLLFIMIAVLVCIEYGQHWDRYIESFCIKRRRDEATESQISDPARFFQLSLVLVLLVVNVVSTVLVSLTLRRNVKDLPKVNNRVNVMLLFVMSLIMFIICFLPKTMCSFIKGHDTTYLKCMAATNCCLDPVLYYFSLDAFWKKKEERKPAQTGVMDRHQRQ